MISFVSQILSKSLEIVAAITFIYLYLLAFLIYKYLVYRIRLAMTLWRLNIPCELRKEFLEMYDEKFDSIISSLNVFNILKTLKKLY